MLPQPTRYTRPLPAFSSHHHHLLSTLHEIPTMPPGHRKVHRRSALCLNSPRLNDVRYPRHPVPTPFYQSNMASAYNDNLPPTVSLLQRVKSSTFKGADQRSTRTQPPQPSSTRRFISDGLSGRGNRGGRKRQVKCWDRTRTDDEDGIEASEVTVITKK